MSCPADRDVAVGQASTANFFEQIQNNLAFTERVEKRTECSKVQAVGSHPHEMARDAANLRNQNSEMNGLFRDFHPDQLLDSQCKAEIHVHRGQIVHPVRVRNVLRRRQVLTDLFCTAMQIADVRRAFMHNFPVGSQQ